MASREQQNQDARGIDFGKHPRMSQPSDTLERLEMSRREVDLLIAIEPVLRRLGLSLYCVRCHAKGIQTGCVPTTPRPMPSWWSSAGA
jgi:hypothetical protein